MHFTNQITLKQRLAEKLNFILKVKTSGNSSHPLFQRYPPFRAKFLVPSPQVTQFLEGHTPPPPLNKGGSNYEKSGGGSEIQRKEKVPFVHSEEFPNYQYTSLHFLYFFTWKLLRRFFFMYTKK